MVSITNRGKTVVDVLIDDGYGKDRMKRNLKPCQSFRQDWSLRGSFGWYDLTITVAGDTTFLRRLAGHVETGAPSLSDPQLGGFVDNA